jgi:hypothetical protein
MPGDGVETLKVADERVSECAERLYEHLRLADHANVPNDRSWREAVQGINAVKLLDASIEEFARRTGTALRFAKEMRHFRVRAGTM